MKQFGLSDEDYQTIYETLKEKHDALEYHIKHIKAGNAMIKALREIMGDEFQASCVRFNGETGIPIPDFDDDSDLRQREEVVAKLQNAMTQLEITQMTE